MIAKCICEEYIIYVKYKLSNINTKIKSLARILCFAIFVRNKGI